MEVSKEAHTFYALMAMLKISNKFIDFLVDGEAVSRGLKQDLNVLRAKIAYLGRRCDSTLEGDEAKQWKMEWSGKDYEVYSNILFLLNDMSEEQRGVAEQFMEELSKGQVKMEAA
jgi:hypothetical protein